MSNVIELNTAEIDTVVGGAGAIQTATAYQATALVRPTAPTTFRPATTSVSSADINAMLTRFEVKR
jgi:hypothetical protein